MVIEYIIFVTFCFASQDTLVSRVSTGVLWHPEGPHWELAVPDLRPWCSAQVSAVPQEGGSTEAHPERDKVGPR